MDNYRFHLEKYHRGSKVACPECKRKACFTRYIDESGEITFPPHVGKCDHEHSCGYHYTPKDSFREHPDELDSFRQEWKPQAVTPKKPVSPPSFIDSAVMQHSLSHYDINPLLHIPVRHDWQKQYRKALQTLPGRDFQKMERFGSILAGGFQRTGTYR